MAKKKITKTKKKPAKKKTAVKAAPKGADVKVLLPILKAIAANLAQINKSLAYLEDIANEVEGIGADTEIIVSQYMGEGDQTETTKGTSA
jgi:hypothetical protein